MASESSPVLKWSSYERSVPEVSIINDSSLKLQTSSFGTTSIPPFEHVMRQTFPICSSPPLKQQYQVNNSQQYLPHDCDTAEKFDKRDLDLFKTEFLSAALKQNLNQLDLFKTEFFSSVRREHKNEIEELKKQVDSIKEQFKILLPHIKSELQAVLNDNKKSSAYPPIQKYEVGTQVCFEMQDRSMQTENFVLDDSPQDIVLKDNVNGQYKPDKRHEGFELRLSNNYEKVKDNNRGMPYQNNIDEYEKDYSESDDDEEHLASYNRPNRINRKALPPDGDFMMDAECYGVAKPGIRRGGYARVQEIRMTNRKQNFPEQPDLAYPAENEMSPEVGNYMCPPQNRHLKPNRFNDDRYQPEFWDPHHPRRILEENEWQGRQMAGKRGGQWRRPALDGEWHHGNTRDDQQYQEEYIYGRHEGAVRGNQWGCSAPNRDNFVGGRREDPNNWEMNKHYPQRGQPPMANRILDITAIKNQPKLT